MEGMTPAFTVSEPELRGQLSNLQGLLALVMLMTESGDEGRILHLAATAVPSLARCRLAGVRLFDTGWHATDAMGAGADALADLDAQLEDRAGPGLAVDVLGASWGFAYPLRSLDGLFGYVVVAATAPPAKAEQFLLQVLAQQTGIALANARLHARERKSAEELQVLNAQLTDTVAALRRSTEIHERLTRAAAAAEGVEAIARAVHELTALPVAIEDGYGNLLAWSGPDQPLPKIGPRIREHTMRRSLAAGRPTRWGPWLLIVAKPPANLIGVIALLDPRALAGEQEQVALEHGATVLAIELVRLASVAETEIRLRRNLVDQLLTGTDDPTVLTRALALGYDLDRAHRVVVVEPADGDLDLETLFDAVQRAARDAELGTLVSLHGRCVVVISEADPSARQRNAFRATLDHRIHGARFRVGVGSPCERPAELPRSFHEAELALKLGRAAGARDVVMYDELGVYRMFAELDDEQAVERFARHWLGALVDYDRKRRSELVLTLSAYLECGGGYDATAAELAMHRSTLKYRLQRIREISGHDLSDPDTRFNLQLAARAWNTLRALSGERT